MRPPRLPRSTTCGSMIAHQCCARKPTVAICLESESIRGMRGVTTEWCHDEWHGMSRRSSRGVSSSANDSSSFFQTPAAGLPERPSMDCIPVPLLLDPTGKYQYESSVVGHPNPSTTTNAAASGSCCSAASGQGLRYSRAQYACHRYLSQVSTVQSALLYILLHKWHASMVQF